MDSLSGSLLRIERSKTASNNGQSYSDGQLCVRMPSRPDRAEPVGLQISEPARGHRAGLGEAESRAQLILVHCVRLRQHIALHMRASFPAERPPFSAPRANKLQRAARQRFICLGSGSRVAGERAGRCPRTLGCGEQDIRTRGPTGSAPAPHPN